MMRISIKSTGSAKLLLFNPAATSFNNFISIAGIKLGEDFEGKEQATIKVYLSNDRERTLVEDVGEIRDGDLIVFERVVGEREGAQDRFDAACGTSGENCAATSVKNEPDEMGVSCGGGSQLLEDDEEEVEVTEVHVKRSSPVVIDISDDSDSDSDSCSDSDSDCEESHPLPFSWMQKDDVELLSSDEEEEDDNRRVIYIISSDDESDDGDEEDTVGAQDSSTTFSRIQGQPPPKKRKIDAKQKSSAKKQMIYGYINPIDLPVAPGTLDSAQEEQSSTPNATTTSTAGNTTGGESLVKVKARIAKMLQLGLHPSTSEAEAQHAMRVAQKLLQKFNLTQAAVLLSQNSHDEKDVEALRGGLVTVQIRRQLRPHQSSASTKIDPSTGLPYTPATTNSWMIWLASAVALNFRVKMYYSGPSAKYTFYGLKTNVQLAAYAFKIAVEKIVIMKDAFMPPAGEFEVMQRRGLTACASKGGYTLACRNSYCEGIVSGIRKSVEKSQLEEEEKRAADLARARERAATEAKRRSRSGSHATAEASNEEGNDTDGDDNDSNSGGEVGGAPVVTRTRGRSEVADEEDEDDDESILNRLEDEEKVSQALTLHTEDVAAKILKSKDIKVKTATRAQRLEVNRRAWAKGVDDSKNINLNERAITE